VSDDRIIIGKFGKAHGRDGKVRLWLYNDDTELIVPGATVVLEDDEPELLVIETVQPRDRFVVVGLEGFNLRDEAESLNHLEISVDRSVLPEPGEDEYYRSDLVGFNVLLRDGHDTIEIGKLVGFLDNVETDVLVVQGPRIQGRWLVAFTKQAVADVNVEGTCITLNPLDEWAHDDQTLLPE
jgi:16S rRNA processing protein RimM